MREQEIRGREIVAVLILLTCPHEQSTVRRNPILTYSERAEKPNFGSPLEVSGSNLACAPFVASFSCVFGLEDCPKSYGRAEESSYKKTP